jgi:hypothetical protein
MHESI